MGGYVLVGDTRFDIEGARAAGISSIGVSFGYGDTDEMMSLGACAIADSMGDIPGLVSSLDL